SDFECVPAGGAWESDDELMVCPNMRAAQIYVRNYTPQRRDAIVSALLADPHVDQVMWRATADGDPEDNRYFVATSDRGRLEFWVEQRETAGASTAPDEYGAAWSWSGDLATVGGSLDSDGILRFEDYPNAFERIATSFDREVSGDIWTTTRPGFEFRRNATSLHDGGSHGSLHALDSQSPLIVAGFARPADWRQTPRSVDVAPLCRLILDLPKDRPLGSSHLQAR
ncbi:MAG: hypothetical protein KY475_23135, partial [Planctomycetes bacterium]|nr:hypothetical protein [Planctomycetota bacterium]